MSNNQQDRPDGWYWVRWAQISTWEPCEWQEGEWQEDYPEHGHPPFKIGDRIPMPDEPPNPAPGRDGLDGLQPAAVPEGVGRADGVGARVMITAVICSRRSFRHWASENPELAGEFKAYRFSRAVCVSCDDDVPKVMGLDVGRIVYYGGPVELSADAAQRLRAQVRPRKAA